MKFCAVSYTDQAVNGDSPSGWKASTLPWSGGDHLFFFVCVHDRHAGDISPTDTLSSLCAVLMEAFAIIPGSTWGTAPSNVQPSYVNGQCNKYSCVYFRKQYGVVPGQTWGTLPQQWQAAWGWDRPADQGGPGNCHTLSGRLVHHG